MVVILVGLGDDSAFPRHGYGGCSVVYAEFVEDVGEVGFDGGFGEDQGLGDVFVGGAVGDLVEYVEFAVAECFHRVGDALEEFSLNLWCEH